MSHGGRRNGKRDRDEIMQKHEGKLAFHVYQRSKAKDLLKDLYFQLQLFWSEWFILLLGNVFVDITNKLKYYSFIISFVLSQDLIWW